MRAIIILSVFITAGCSAPTVYKWQDTRVPERESAVVDLDYCRDFTARQYKPGIPSGEPYLKEQRTPSDPTAEYQTGEWRPDRDPIRETSIHSLPTHDVPVEYTGYPGELDYYPDYLDDILEKCMLDKGWRYLPTPKEAGSPQKTNEPIPGGKGSPLTK